MTGKPDDLSVTTPDFLERLVVGLIYSVFAVVFLALAVALSIIANAILSN